MRRRQLTKDERETLYQRAYDVIAAINFFIVDGGRGPIWQDNYVLAIGVQRLLDDFSAADEEIARLRKALEDIANHEEGIGPECPIGSGNMGCEECGEKINIARNALKD